MSGLVFNTRSLRFQLTARILMVMVPCFALSYLIIQLIGQRLVTHLTEARLKSDAGLISYGLSQWGESNQQKLKLLAFDDALRERRPAEAQRLLNALQQIFPDREWRYWSADAQPRLLAATGKNITPENIREAEQSILKRGYFRRALQGNSDYSVIRSYLTNESCLMFAQPVFARFSQMLGSPSDVFVPDGSGSITGLPGASSGQDQAMQLPSPAGRPTGILLSCLRLERLGAETGLSRALPDSKFTAEAGGFVDFEKVRRVKRSFLLVSRMGHLLYPNAQGQHHIPMASDYVDGYWGPIFRIAQKAKLGQNSFVKVNVGGESYFVLLNTVDSAWSTLLILGEKEAFKPLMVLRQYLFAVGLASILITSLAIAWQCGRLATPIRRAGKALQRISEGDFEGRITHKRQDEIGALLDNINTASEQLKVYLEKETAGAVIQKQLETAREIQKDFLVSQIPQSEQLELAPVFLPAYEVGADWYDAVRIGDVTVFVVADVCDKGIPSALYMSVFRSLLRYGLLTHLGQADSGEDTGRHLQEVVTLVNDYMATNHGDSLMFATVFMGAVQASTGQLYYISAGHEMPMLCRQGSHQWLEQTGPALGLFVGAAYSYGQVALQAGDYLVAYTDGLTDARSPENIGWGRDALEQFMAERAGGAASAATVLAELVETVQAHMGGSDQFDDLTMMVLRVSPTATADASGADAFSVAATGVAAGGVEVSAAAAQEAAPCPQPVA